MAARQDLSPKGDDEVSDVEEMSARRLRVWIDQPDRRPERLCQRNCLGEIAVVRDHDCFVDESARRIVNQVNSKIDVRSFLFFDDDPGTGEPIDSPSDLVTPHQPE